MRTCKDRREMYKDKPYFEGTREAKMSELVEWIEQADRIITF